MDGKTYKLIELTGTSNKSIEEAVQTALAEAVKSVRNLRWFEVIDTRGTIDSSTGKVSEWQVTIKAGFRIEP
jgi:flavin-binding protein dodecin